MKNMFENPWRVGGVHNSGKILETSSTQNLVTGLPNIILEDPSKNKIEIGVETILRLKVEGIADNSWGGPKYEIVLNHPAGVSLSTSKFSAEKGWILETKVRGNNKGDVNISVNVNKTSKNNISLSFYEIDKSPKMLSSFGTNGFTLGKKTDGTLISIPVYFKVSEVKFIEEGNREEFLMLEWPYINERASVKCEAKNKSRFIEPTFEAAAKIYFNKAKGELKYGGNIISAYTDPNDPISNGMHIIWLPDYFHSYGNPYLGNSKYSGIWFRIGNESSDRYLHVGSVSLGCVSVGKSSAADSTPEFEKWSNLYIYLSKKRSGNKFIGEIIVS